MRSLDVLLGDDFLFFGIIASSSSSSSSSSLLCLLLRISLIALFSASVVYGTPVVGLILGLVSKRAPSGEVVGVALLAVLLIVGPIF